MNESNIFNSTHNIVTPLFESTLDADDRMLQMMFDLHSEPVRRRAIDKMMNCHRRYLDGIQPDHNCSLITDVVTAINYKSRGPTAIIMEPILPAKDPEILTGFIVNLLIWDELLENIFADKVSGIDCVLEENGQSYTYRITEGVAKYVDLGDLHERHYTSLGHCVNVTDDPSYCPRSPTYKLCVYPCQELFKSYQTNNPKVAAIGAVSTILFTSLLFFLYDFLIRRDVSSKKNLLHAKRQFMRFVSHEVRTPLSAVCMGLNVMQTEIASSLGYMSTDQLEAIREEEETIQEKKTDGDNNDDRDSPEQNQQQETKQISSKDALEWYSMAKEVLSNTQNAVNILNDLLNYDKIESGKLTLELTTVPIWALIQQTAKEFKLAAERKHITLNVQWKENTNNNTDEEFGFDHKQRYLVGDAVRITQVLRNLISNALKFTPEHGNVRIHAQWISKDDDLKNAATKCNRNSSIKKEMADDTFVLKNGKVETYQRGGSLVLWVHDTGAGMTKEQLSKLFRAGMQFNVNELQNGKGSGLGLYIAKGIVEQHNGTLQAESKGLGMGTSFRMQLPLHLVLHNTYSSCTDSSRTDFSDGDTYDNEDNSNDGQEINSKRKLLPSPPQQQKPLRILAVDDSPSVRKLLCRLLEKRGYLCEQAQDGKEALEKIVENILESTFDNKNNHPSCGYDAILLDFEMPTMNGPDACRAMRALPDAMEDVLIIGITGNLLPQDVQHFLNNGANAVLGKPVDMQELYALLSTIRTKCKEQN